MVAIFILIYVILIQLKILKIIKKNQGAKVLGGQKVGEGGGGKRRGVNDQGVNDQGANDQGAKVPVILPNPFPYCPNL